MRRVHQWIVNRWTIISFVLLLFLVAGVFIFYPGLRDLLTWPNFIAGIEAVVIMICWRKCPKIRRLVGADQQRSRPQIISFVLLMLFFAPFSLYFLTGGTDQQLPQIAQFSIVAVTATLGGLILTAASLDSQRRSEFIHVAQKLIVATVLFITYVVCMQMVALSGGIDTTSLASNLWDPLAWSRGLYFWLAVPCFYIGVFLFMWGLKDLVFVLADKEI